jgi:hypothetical protein
MELHPDHASGQANSLAAQLFPEELSEGFESALARVAPASADLPGRSRLSRLFRRLARRRGARELRRAVAFDGFRSGLHDEKTERDRRYGTVYAVEERANAYLIRLEMPRIVPDSALGGIWKLGAVMPDYNYAIRLRPRLLRIRAGVPGEALRRLSYVLSSFPADFETLIELGQPVRGFVHRLRDKVLEIIVFKNNGDDAAARSRLAERE